MDYLSQKNTLPKILTDINLETLKESVIIIYGGTSGIGKEIAKLAAEYKAKIFSYSRRTGNDIIFFNKIKQDLCNLKKIHGKIDYVINTAAILQKGAIIKRDITEIINEIETNYIGPVFITKFALEIGCKSILLFGSSSYSKGRENYSIYSSTKAAVVNFTQAIAKETSNMNINVIVPQRTNTPMRRKSFGIEPDESLLDPKIVAEISLKTLLTEITGAIIKIIKEKDKITPSIQIEF